MRLIVIKQASDLLTLSKTLFNDGADCAGIAAAHNVTLDRIKSLNPQVDFNRMEAGTVLLLPDAPDLKDTESQSIAGDAFADFTSQLTEGLGIAAQHLSGGIDALKAERKAVTAVLATNAVKREVDSDQSLRKQLEAATESFATEQKEMQEAARQVQTMQLAVAEDLAVLANLLL